MVRHHLRLREPGWRRGALINSSSSSPPTGPSSSPSSSMWTGSRPSGGWTSSPSSCRSSSPPAGGSTSSIIRRPSGSRPVSTSTRRRSLSASPSTLRDSSGEAGPVGFRAGSLPIPFSHLGIKQGNSSKIHVRRVTHRSGNPLSQRWSPDCKLPDYPAGNSAWWRVQWGRSGWSE